MTYRGQRTAADREAIVRAVHTSEADVSPRGPIRLLRFQAVRDRTGLSRSTIWRLERRGTFPRHRRISLNAVGWIEHEVNAWIQSRTM